jgi:hypothetical protein
MCDLSLNIEIMSGKVKLKKTVRPTGRVIKRKTNPSEIKKGLNYGSFKIPFQIEDRGVILSFGRIDPHTILYKRSYPEKNEVIEKTAITSSNQIILNPIEPVNKPKHLTPYLLIEFKKPIMIQPKIRKNVFLKFPLELGVFIASAKGNELIDIFTFAKEKYTLYGDQRLGVLCRYWQSEVYNTIPETKPLDEGVIELKISNPTSKWIELTKVVFNAYGMKLYYKPDLVSLNTTIKIQSELVAETEVLSTPLQKGMKQAIEVYPVLRPPVILKTFVMEGGL